MTNTDAVLVALILILIVIVISQYKVWMPTLFRCGNKGDETFTRGKNGKNVNFNKFIPFPKKINTTKVLYDSGPENYSSFIEDMVVSKKMKDAHNRYANELKSTVNVMRAESNLEDHLLGQGITLSKIKNVTLEGGDDVNLRLNQMTDFVGYGVQ